MPRKIFTKTKKADFREIFCQNFVYFSRKFLQKQKKAIFAKKLAKIRLD
jgi:hypothetical protein